MRVRSLKTFVASTAVVAALLVAAAPAGAKGPGNGNGSKKTSTTSITADTTTYIGWDWQPDWCNNTCIVLNLTAP